MTMNCFYQNLKWNHLRANRGPAFVPASQALELGVDGDTCHGEDVATDMFGEKNVTFFPSSSKAALEGSYNNEPYRQPVLRFYGGFRLVCRIKYL